MGLVQNNKSKGNHAFNIDVAIKIGVDKAVLLANIVFWLGVNKDSNSNNRDGYIWMYNSARSFQEHMPYWSMNKIQKMLTQLVTDGYLMTSNFNKAKYDRTKWYTTSDFSIAEKQEGQTPCDLAEQANGDSSDLAEQANGDSSDSAEQANGGSGDLADQVNPSNKTAEPIPDINADINKTLKDKTINTGDLSANEIVKTTEADFNSNIDPHRDSNIEQHFTMSSENINKAFDVVWSAGLKGNKQKAKQSFKSLCRDANSFGSTPMQVSSQVHLIVSQQIKNGTGKSQHLKTLMDRITIMSDGTLILHPAVGSTASKVEATRH